MNRRSLLQLGLTTLAYSSAPSWSSAEAQPVVAPALRKGDARVVFVGDSITGQSRNHPQGYGHVFDWVWPLAFPGKAPQVVSLGGSGMGVNAWVNTEIRSRTEDFHLDLKSVSVRDTLARPVDVLVIMLGMNDVLAPYVVDEAESWQKWEQQYRALVAGLRSRLNPAVTGLASVTLCTEDANSPKNRMVKLMNQRIAAIAHELGLRYLPTHETMQEVLDETRRRKPAEHVVPDLVHPNALGHLAITLGMLRGLGEEAASKIIQEQRIQPILDQMLGKEANLSYRILDRQGDGERTQTRIRYSWMDHDTPSAEQPNVSVHAEGWTVAPGVSLRGDTGVFQIDGESNKLTQTVVLEGKRADKRASQTVTLPAGWRVCAGISRAFWKGDVFDVSKARGPVDEAFAGGKDFTLVPGHQWHAYYPSVDYTGYDAPGSVDFAAVTHAHPWEGGYAVRWVYSDKDRPVQVDISSQIFAGAIHLQISLGEVIYEGVITKEPKKRTQVSGSLKKGWNTLFVNTSHQSWQWQFRIDLAPVEGDSLDDLRYSIAPPQV